MSTLNNIGAMAGMDEMLELARLLRKNGDVVLSGASKLSLSTKLLHNMNNAFSIIVDDTQGLDSSFHVCNSSKNDVFRNIKFLHDFVQKTLWLKVSHIGIDPKLAVDITKFRHLKILEFRKVCIELVSGIQGVRGQLESISCTGGGGVRSIGRLLAACGGDAGVGFIWASLKRLALPYNGIERLDKSLELVPWLQALDLSHNLIVSTRELDCLPNLKYINLGYNKLESAPVFNRITYQTLQILVLKNNYIENLNGLQGLDCLAELDLSNNCLTEHSVLWPLETMSALLWVSLEGNPLFYHKKHRLLTIKHLHSALSESKFVLDQQPLSKSEKLSVSRNRVFTMRSARSPSKDDVASLSASIMSNVTLPSVENPYHNDLIISNSSELMDSTESMVSRSRRKKYVCEAIITDDDDKENAVNMSSSILSSTLLETSADHLETKKQILALRAKFGDEKWLVSDAASFVQNIMGLERTNVPTLEIAAGLDPSLNIVPVMSVANCSTDFSTDSAVWSNESSNDDASADTIVPSIEKTELEENDETIVESGNDKTVTIEEQIDSTEVTEPFYDPEEEKGDLFLVHKKLNNESIQEFFLVITPEEIKERDSITGCLKCRWSTDTVLSCVMGRGEATTIDFIFDTTRKDRQNRTYFVEKEDASKIVKIVGELIKVRPILLKVFKCMKCSTHFSQDPDYISGLSTTSIFNIKPPKCPTCRSTLVIETDELLAPDVHDVKKDMETSPLRKSFDDNTVEESLQHSESHSSIGGTGGGAMPVTTSLVQFDPRPQAQVSCSATSLEESRESTPSASTVTKRYESDIEILSNPSQSSIEVLDDGTKASLTPNRKRSSEERRVAIAPTLLTIPDTAPIMAGLTESSSSGSLTDSICTAYENTVSSAADSERKRSGRKIHENDKPTNTETSKLGTSTTPGVNLSSMLGGLLHSMKIGAPKGGIAKVEEDSDLIESDVEYSYDNFESVDHRIKLHLILNIFEEENEKLHMLLRAQMVTSDSTNPFQGCLVLSNNKIYVLKIVGPESGDPQRWLHKETTWPNEKLRRIAALPFQQGVMLELHTRNKPHDEPAVTTIACTLQDSTRTSQFLDYLAADSNMPLSCDVDRNTPEHYTRALQRLLLSAPNCDREDRIRFLTLFTMASYTQQERDIKLKSGCLIVTQSVILLTDEKLQWLLPMDKGETNIITEHAISNLIEVTQSDCSLGFSFIDELGGVEDIWRFTFVTSSAAKAVINAIKEPWEELFSVPLQVSNGELG